jgi:hypothetical protein
LKESEMKSKAEESSSNFDDDRRDQAAVGLEGAAELRSRCSIARDGIGIKIYYKRRKSTSVRRTFPLRLKGMAAFPHP